MFIVRAVRLPLVLVADPVAAEGLDVLRPHTELLVQTGLEREQLREAVREADALLVRSETQVTRDVLYAAERLRVIARAGAGVDNIDVAAATERGVLVINAPGGNTIAAAEHTIAMLLAAARHIAPADAALKRGEWARSRFVGVEVRGKVLGIIGLGRVGTEVARRAQGLEMRVLVHDPYVSAEHARRLEMEPAELDTLLSQADFATVHTPLTEQTRGLLGGAALARMKSTAFLINCARGGVVDEAALLAALDSGRLGGAAIDVFAEEPATDNPLARHPRVVATPHLGASTVEAQEAVARQVAEQVLNVLQGKPAQFAVNAPSLAPEVAQLLSPYVDLAGFLGSLAIQLADGRFRAATITCRGELVEHDTSILTAAAIRGLLAPITSQPVNLVNASLIARSRGLRVSEQRTVDSEPYTSLVEVAVQTERGETLVAGTVMHQQPHVVRIGEFSIDLVPTEGYMLLTRHRDRPGMIGKVGTLLGEADVNISSMQVGRRERRGEAIMLISVDEPVPADLLARLRAIESMDSVRVIQLQ
ncbi:MAG TPA: phosphoglycerate dehydrogenase [Chloroflexota bacterium]|nr:phosphoglycerate dehydrogenase [Chloroflexota bacterium]